MEYDPVCVKVNGVRYRYGNPCMAACDGYGEDDYVRCLKEKSPAQPGFYISGRLFSKLSST